MATEKILNTRVQLKYDSYANWTSTTLGDNKGANFVLKAGEIGICYLPTDYSEKQVVGSQPPQILFKVGNGSAKFSELPWASAKAADVYEWAKQASLPVTKVGDGNVVAGIEWDEASKGIKFTTASVATSEGMEQLANRVTAIENGYATDAELAAAVEAINTAIAAKADKTYVDEQLALKVNTSDFNTFKTENTTAIGTAKSEAIAAAKTETETQVGALRDGAVKDNTDAIALKADQTALNAVSAVANAAATQTALAEEIARAQAAEKVNADAIERLTNGVSQEEIDGVNDLINYVNEHGAEVTGIKADIKANADAIAAIPQADWNQNDSAAADYVKNRTHYEGVDYALISEHTVTTNNEVSEGIYKSEFDTSVAPYETDSKTTPYRVVFDGVTYDNVYIWYGCCGNPNLYDGNEYQKADMVNPEVPFAFSFESQGMGYAYATTSGEHTVAFYKETSTIKQLDEKFIPDTIARTADVDALEAADSAMQVEIAKKANDADLAAIAKTGSTDDLVQGEMVLVFDCGSSTV